MSVCVVCARLYLPEVQIRDPHVLRAVLKDLVRQGHRHDALLATLAKWRVDALPQRYVAPTGSVAAAGAPVCTAAAQRATRTHPVEVVHRCLRPGNALYDPQWHAVFCAGYKYLSEYLRQTNVH